MHGVHAAGVDAKGLALMVTCTPSPLGSLAIAGAPGQPGGILSWRGQWQTATSYAVVGAVERWLELRRRLGSTSGALTEPGVGANWQTVWMLLAGGPQLQTLQIVAVISSAYPLTAGTKVYVPVYFACTIQATLPCGRRAAWWCDLERHVRLVPAARRRLDYGLGTAHAERLASPPTPRSPVDGSIAAGRVLAFQPRSVATIRLLTVALKVERT